MKENQEIIKAQNKTKYKKANRFALVFCFSMLLIPAIVPVYDFGFFYDSVALMLSVTYIVAIPFGIGLLHELTYQNSPDRVLTKGDKQFNRAVVITYLVFWIAVPSILICFIFLVPIHGLFFLIGKVVGRYIFQQIRNVSSNLLSLIPALSIVLGFFEFGFFQPVPQLGNCENEIVINAPAATVWPLICRVDSISEAENTRSLFQFAGFPRPVVATLDSVNIGSLRKAYFAEGLYFIEIVNELETGRKLGFSIATDSASRAASRKIDAHILVGGNLFDVFQGTYQIVDQGDKTLLLLKSKFKITSNIHPYAGFCARLVMGDVQGNILNIIKNRAENKSVLN